jgi:hypothetical protein
MASTEYDWAALVVHTSTSSEATRGIDAQFRVADSGTGLFRYVLRADISRVRIPPAQSAQRADDLWKHTCFEAFIGAPGAAGYYELNFAPSGRWAVYRFDAYREGMSSPDVAVPPEISVRRFADRLEVDAALRLGNLTALQGTSRLRVGLSAVVEEQNGTLSYWALKHGAGKADFHSPDGFVLELAM